MKLSQKEAILIGCAIAAITVILIFKDTPNDPHTSNGESNNLEESTFKIPNKLTQATLKKKLAPSDTLKLQEPIANNATAPDPGKIVEDWIAQLPAEQKEAAATAVTVSELLLGCSVFAEILKDPAYGDVATFCRNETSRVPIHKGLLPRYAGLALRVPVDDPSLATMSLPQLAMLAGQGPAADAFAKCEEIGMPEMIQTALHDKVVSTFVTTVRNHIAADKIARNK